MDGGDPVNDQLRCPICFEIPGDVVHQCKNGHHICSECSGSLVDCPQCRVRYEQPKIRNRVVESLLDSMEFECTYKEKGCVMKVKRNLLSDHVKSCKFRSINICKLIGFNNCNYIAHPIPMVTIKHLQQSHGITVCHGSEMEMCYGNFVEAVIKPQNIPTRWWPPILWKLDKDDYSPTFLILSKVTVNFLSPKSCLWMCLYLGDSPEEAAKYKVEFSIQNVFGHGQDAELKWKSTVHHYRKLEILLQEPSSFLIPANFFEEHAGLKQKNNVCDANALIVKMGIKNVKKVEDRDVLQRVSIKL